MDMRPRTRRRLLISAALLVIAAIFGTVIAISAWNSGTPAAGPSPSATQATQEREPDQTTTPTPSPSQNEHEALPLTGVAEGDCEEGTNGVTCRIDSVVYANSDGLAQLQQGGSQYLLVKCTDSACTASSVTKFELPCVIVGSNNVFCADAPEDRRSHYQRLIGQVRNCIVQNGVVECVPQKGTSVSNGQLSVGWLPAEAAIVNGRVGIYAAAAPVMNTIQVVSDCSVPDADTIQCRKQGSGSSDMPAHVSCGFDAQNRLLCGTFHPSRAAEQSISVYCPGGHAVTCSLTRQDEWFANRLDCGEEVSGQPGLRVCTRTD